VSRLAAFGRFWYEFVVGDDWRAAVGVIVALGLSAVALSLSSSAWWLLPLSIVAVLTESVLRAARNS
jgi:uncharacterized membrane protein